MYQRAVSLYPDSSVLHCHLGIALSELGDTESAAAEFEISISLDPKNLLPKLKHASVLIALGQPAVRV